MTETEQIRLLLFILSQGRRLSEPLINVTELEEVVFEWWCGIKKLTIYSTEEGLDALKVCSGQIDEVAIDSQKEVIRLFEWLS